MKMELFCTAGRGTEDFVIEELNMKLKANQITKTDGKVLFQTEKSDALISQLLNLKCVERLFVKIYHNTNFVASNGKALTYLGRELFKVHWPVAVENLKEFKLTNFSLLQVEIRKEDESPHSKKAKTEAAPDGDKTTFRVSCKLAGKPSRVLTTLVFCQINNEGVIIGLPVTEKPLSQRNYVKTFGLRSTIAWILSYLGEIKGAVYYGADNDGDQLKISEENIAFSKAFEVNLIHCCVSELPFRDNTIDVIICDTPFGINHSSREGVVDLYPSMVTEINRITKVGARIVLLTSQALKEKLLETVSKICGLYLDSKVSVQKATFCNEADTRSSQWCLKCSKYLKLGETDSRVLSFLKQEIKK